MAGRAIAWVERAVFFRIGRLLVRAMTLNRVDPARDGRAFAPVVFAGALVVLAALGGAAVLLDAPPAANPARGLFGSRARFQAHVEAIKLGALSLRDAADRLQADGFRCEAFAGGQAACERAAKGALCGELQFVDLIAPGSGNAPLGVQVRFSRTCFAGRREAR